MIVGGGSSRTAGLAQGSILSPSLFTTLINDLLQSLTTSFGFADDLKLLIKIAAGGDCCIFQLEMNQFDEWYTIKRF